MVAEVSAAIDETGSPVRKNAERRERIEEKRIVESFLLPETKLFFEFRIGAFDGKGGLIAELIGGHARRMTVGEGDVCPSFVNGVDAAVVVEEPGGYPLRNGIAGADIDGVGDHDKTGGIFHPAEFVAEEFALSGDEDDEIAVFRRILLPVGVAVSAAFSGTVHSVGFPAVEILRGVRVRRARVELPAGTYFRRFFSMSGQYQMTPLIFETK